MREAGGATGEGRSGGSRARTRAGAGLIALALATWSAAPGSASGGDGVWTSHGPPRGSVLALAIDPNAPSTIYAGANAGGIFRTDNGAANWIPLVTAGAAVRSLALAPPVVYAGTAGTGVLKSLDRGATWAAANTDLGDLSVTAVAVDPRTALTAYAGTAAGGVFKTVDGGASWVPSNAGLLGLAITALLVDPTAPDTVYAGDADSRIARSVNGGTSWSPTGALPASGAVNALAADPSAPGTVYAGTAASGVFKTVNGGAGWSPANAGLTSSNVTALSVDPLAPAVLYAGTSANGVFRSANGAGSWDPLNTGLGGFFARRVRSLVVDPRGSGRLLAGTQGGVYRSDASGAWTQHSLGLRDAVRVLGVAPAAAERVYAGLTLSGVFLSPDGGLSWQPTSGALPLDAVNAVAVDAQSADIVYVGTNTGGSRSGDGGASWTLVLNTAVSAIAVDPGTPGTAYAASGTGLKKTIDGGLHWTDTGLPAGLTAVAVDGGHVVYAGNATNGVFKSIDGGTTWNPTGFPAGTPLIALVAGLAEIYAVGGAAGVLRSTDGGATWPQLPGAPAGMFVTSLVVDPTGGVFYAGTREGGVFRGTAGGGPWVPVNDGLPVAQVDGLAISPSGGCLHAGTPAGAFVLAVHPDPCAPARRAAPVSAMLPGSRSVQVGSAATAFATMVDTAGAELRDCVIAPAIDLPLRFSFQTTDPATNALVGSPDTATTIPRSGLQTFVVSLVPTAPFAPTDVALTFSCANAEPAAIVVGVNTLLLSAAAGPVPDIVALGATPSGDGIVRIPGATGTGFFVVATVNVGSGALVTASADTGGAVLPVLLAVCQTDPATAQCLSPPGPSVQAQIDAGATPTFAVFAAGQDIVVFDPAHHRFYLRFRDETDAIRGATSAAALTE